MAVFVRSSIKRTFAKDGTTRVPRSNADDPQTWLAGVNVDGNVEDAAGKESAHQAYMWFAMWKYEQYPRKHHGKTTDLAAFTRQSQVDRNLLSELRQKFRELCRRFVRAKWFRYSFDLVVVLYVLNMSKLVLDLPSRVEHVIEIIFMAILSAELVVRFSALNHLQKADAALQFDTLAVALAAVDLWLKPVLTKLNINMAIFSSLRILRLSRLFRLWRYVPCPTFVKLILENRRKLVSGFMEWLLTFAVLVTGLSVLLKLSIHRDGDQSSVGFQDSIIQLCRRISEASMVGRDWSLASEDKTWGSSQIAWTMFHVVVGFAHVIGGSVILCFSCDFLMLIKKAMQTGAEIQHIAEKLSGPLAQSLDDVDVDGNGYLCWPELWYGLKSNVELREMLGMAGLTGPETLRLADLNDVGEVAISKLVFNVIRRTSPRPVETMWREAQLRALDKLTRTPLPHMIQTEKRMRKIFNAVTAHEEEMWKQISAEVDIQRTLTRLESRFEVASNVFKLWPQASDSEASAAIAAAAPEPRGPCPSSVAADAVAAVTASEPLEAAAAEAAVEPARPPPRPAPTAAADVWVETAVRGSADAMTALVVEGHSCIAASILSLRLSTEMQLLRRAVEEWAASNELPSPGARAAPADAACASPSVLEASSSLLAASMELDVPAGVFDEAECVASSAVSECASI